MLVIVAVVVAGYTRVTAASQLCRSALSYVSGLNSARRATEGQRAIGGAYGGWRHDVDDDARRHVLLCLLCRVMEPLM